MLCHQLVGGPPNNNNAKATATVCYPTKEILVSDIQRVLDQVLGSTTWRRKNVFSPLELIWSQTRAQSFQERKAINTPSHLDQNRFSVFEKQSTGLS